MFLFRSKQFDADRFELELKKITSKISKNEKKLRTLKIQKKHFQKIIPIYLCSGYLVYFSYLYKVDKVKETRNLVLLILIPLLISVLYYVTFTVFGYLINKKENYIEILKAQHEEKLNVLKDQTNFDKTRDLLARFSDGEDIKELEKQVDEIRQKKEQYLKMINEGQAQDKVFADIKKNETGGIYDNLINAILGENELDPNKRYALICSNCLNHNGLAPPGKLPSEVKYICPKCNVLQGSEETNDQESGKESCKDDERDGDKNIGKDDKAEEKDNKEDKKV